MEKTKKSELNTSLLIATIALFSYSASYFARSVLGVVKIEMEAEGVFTGVQIGTMISVAMLAYAVAQLATGVLGDFVKSKYMIGGGLLLAGLSTLVIPMSDSFPVVTVAYMLSNVFLSPIFGAVTKTIAENVVPRHASRVALPVSFATVFGAPLAGVAALVFNWGTVFFVSGGMMILLGVLSFIFFLVGEKKGWIVYRPRVKTEKKGIDVKLLLSNSILQFLFVALLVGISNSTSQLLTTYFKDFLGFSQEASKGIFTVTSFIRSAAPFFFNLFLYEVVFRRNAKKTLLCVFLAAICGYTVTFFTGNLPWLNVTAITIANLACGGYGAILFSVYCPGLRRVGAVSSISSFINCVNYAVGALATFIITNIVGAVGWQTIVLGWLLLMMLGLIVTLTLKTGNFEGRELPAKE